MKPPFTFICLLVSAAIFGKAQAQLVDESLASMSMAENFLQVLDEKNNGAVIGMMGKSGKGKGKGDSCSIESLNDAKFFSYADWYEPDKQGYVGSFLFTLSFNLPADNSDGRRKLQEGQGSAGRGVMEAVSCDINGWSSYSLVAVQTGFVSPSGSFSFHVASTTGGVDSSFFGEYNCNTGQMMIGATGASGRAWSTYPPMVRDDSLELNSDGCVIVPPPPVVHGKSGKGSEPLGPRLPLLCYDDNSCL